MIPPPAGGAATASCRNCVYLLQSDRDGTYYVGWTTEPLRRLVEHNQGTSPYTRRKRPWRLLGMEWYGSPAEAKAQERILKHQPHKLQLFKKRVLNRAANGRPQQVVG